MNIRAILLIFSATLAVTIAAENKKIVCYWRSWSIYRRGDGAFDLSYMDPKLCTHIIYAFAGLSPNGEVQIVDPWIDLPDGSGKDNYNRFNKLREQNPALKTLIAIGGWDEGSWKYSKVAADPNLRRTMVESIVAFVKKYNFDGLDFDWQYPVQGGLDNGGRPVDKQNFVLLLKELRERFDQEDLLLSAAVGAVEKTASQSYNIPEISKYLHFINLMTYELHDFRSGKTGIDAPLYAASSETPDDAKLNVDAIIKYWLSNGAPAEKLVLGVSFYVRSFTLSNSKVNDVGATARIGDLGPYTNKAGLLGYDEICLKIKNDNWQIKYDEGRKAIYAYGGNQWVSFDNEMTLKEKTDYVKAYNLGGVMVWSIDTDDFRGNCGQKWPLLKVLYKELASEASSIPTQPSISKEKEITESRHQPQEPQQPQVSPETQLPHHPQEPHEPQKPQEPQGELPTSNGKLCRAEGHVRDPQDCSKFYYCRLSLNHSRYVYKALPLKCPVPLLYDTLLSKCNWPDKVECNNGVSPNPTKPWITTEETITTPTQQPHHPQQPQKPQKPMQPPQPEHPEDPKEPKVHHELPESQYPQHTEKPQESEVSQESPQSQQPQEEIPTSNGKLCRAEGYVRDSQDCSKFYYCRLLFIHSRYVYETLPYKCPAPLLYDTSLSKCNWPDKVECNNGVFPNPTKPWSTTEETITEPTQQPPQPQKPQKPQKPQQPIQPEQPQQSPKPHKSQEPPQPEYPEEPTEPRVHHESPEFQQPQEEIPTSSGAFCRAEGYVRDPQDCRKFYYCRLSLTHPRYIYEALPYNCPAPLLYDTSLFVCNWPNKVQCGTSVSPNPWDTKRGAVTELSRQPKRPQQHQKSQQPMLPQQPKVPQQPKRPTYSRKLCRAEGYVRDPQDCSKFYYCRFFNNVYEAQPFNCPAPLMYDTSLGVCNWPVNVQC